MSTELLVTRLTSILSSWGQGHIHGVLIRADQYYILSKDHSTNDQEECGRVKDEGNNILVVFSVANISFSLYLSTYLVMYLLNNLLSYLISCLLTYLLSYLLTYFLTYLPT